MFCSVSFPDEAVSTIHIKQSATIQQPLGSGISIISTVLGLRGAGSRAAHKYRNVLFPRV